MTNSRFHPRGIDPLDGAVGDGIVIGSDGQFTVGPVGSGGGSGGGGGVDAAGASISHFDFFGPESRGAEALADANTGGIYEWPGDALTASTITFRFDLGLRRALSATWRVVWVPNSAANGIRLIHADDGPANITQFAELTGNAATTPIHTATDVTAIFNGFIDGGVYKHLGHQIKAGATGPKIHMSRLEVVWEGGTAGGATGGTAADITVDDSSFTHVAGADVQTALASIDGQLDIGGTPTIALVPLTTVIGGVPELVWDEDNNLVMTEVPL